MMLNSPHYLLFSEASRQEQAAPCWRFVLQNVETQRRFSATDTESALCGERLELLAVVRGLEALDGPARVTLVTKSRYVSRGLKSGLAEWRRNDWSWERFGRMVPVRDHDLWKRVDRALGFHQVSCQAWQFDAPAEGRESREVNQPLSTPRERPSRRRARPARRSERPSLQGRKARLSADAAARSGLIDRVWEKVHQAGHLPAAAQALIRSVGHSSGAPA